MKSTSFILSLLCLFSTTINAESSNLKNVLKQTAEKISTVEDKKYRYEQTLTWNENRPYKVVFETVRTGSKGGPLTETYHFNLADFDVNSIRWKNERDKINVTLTADNRLKSIQYFKEGEMQNYTDNVQIIAVDVDNAKEIEGLLKSTIADAKKMFEAELNLNSFEERKSWMQKNIVEFTAGDDRFIQSVAWVADYPSVLSYELVTEKKNEKWQFNLADIRAQTVELQVNGKDVYVELKTKASEKYIRYESSDELKGYDSDLKIYLSNIDAARHLKNILKDLIPESEKAMKSHTPQPESGAAALELLATSIGKVTENLNVYDQKIEANCITTLTIEGTEKDKPVDEVYTLNLGDLNDKKLALGVKGTSLFVETNVPNKKALVQVMENGESSNYSDDFTVRAEDIEQAKTIMVALETAIVHCKENIKLDVPTGDAQTQINWLSTHIKSVKSGSKDYSQTLKMMEGETCKWEFVLMTDDGKKNVEEIYQFNLSDIDSKRIDFEISKQEMGFIIATKRSEKIIKYFKDGEPDNYQNEFLIRANSVEAARNMMESMRQAIEGCE